MRRMRQALKRDYTLKKPVVVKDAEGNTSINFTNATAIQAIIRHASRMLDTAQYGEHLLDILKMQYEGAVEIAEGDGVCVFVDANADPDYRITSCKGITDDVFHVYTLEIIR